MGDGNDDLGRLHPILHPHHLARKEGSLMPCSDNALDAIAEGAPVGVTVFPHHGTEAE